MTAAARSTVSPSGMARAIQWGRRSMISSSPSARSLLGNGMSRRYRAGHEQSKEAGGRVRAGRCVLGLGRAIEARGQLIAARDVWSSLGARPLIEEVDAYLAE